MGTFAITGAASGIGAATLARLANQGHRVIGVDLKGADISCDLGTADGRADAVERVSATSDGVLDGLVTCAGVGGFPGRTGEQIVSVNYFGTVDLLNGLRPLLAAAQAPAAVCISSMAATTMPGGWPVELADACLDGDEVRARELGGRIGGVLAYPAAKAAVAWHVRRAAVSAEWIGAGIRLNAVAPGLIETAMIDEGRQDPEYTRLLERVTIPVGRPGHADEMAAVITFLLGPDARFICGSVVFADGGTDAQLRQRDWPAPWHPVTECPN